MNPLISIITVCFNSAKTIRQTIESVLNQTYTNIEYILVDGKSTDNTVEIIKEYEPKFAEKGIIYRWISEPDNGIYDAMNKGIKMATGEWINFQGSDDWLELNASFSFSEDSQKNQKYDIFLYSTFIWDKKNRIKLRPDIKRIDKFLMPTCHQGIFTRRSLLLGGFNTIYSIAADYDFICTCYHDSKKFHASNKVIANYNLTGVSSSDIPKLLNEYLTISKKYSKSHTKITFLFFYRKLKMQINFYIKRLVSTKLIYKLKYHE